MDGRLSSLQVIASLGAILFAASCGPTITEGPPAAAPTSAPASSTPTSTGFPPLSTEIDVTAMATVTPPHIPACPPEDPSGYPEWAIATPDIALLSSLDPKDMLGLVFSYDVLPYGLDLVTGTLVMEDNRVLTPHPETVDYVLFHVRRAGSDGIWLTRGLCIDIDGEMAYAQVVDVLAVFPLPRTQVFFSHGCSLNGSEDPEILAVVAAEHPIPAPYSNINPLGGSSHVLRAWRASRSTGLFVEIPPDGITCQIVGEGRSFHWDEP